MADANRDTFGTVAGVVFLLIWGGIFLVGWLDGGGEENPTGAGIDCRNPGMEHSPYCNGEYEASIQEQDANEDAYYQGTVRY